MPASGAKDQTACDFTGLSVIMGAIDETDSLRRTIEKIRAVCAPKDIEEIIIVTAGRTRPETMEVIEKLITETKDFTISTFRQSLPGIGGAYRDGLDAARGSHATFITSDDEIDGSCIGEMVRLSRLHPDLIVKADRFSGHRRPAAYDKKRFFFLRCGQIMIKLLYHTDIEDITNAMQSMPRRYYKGINWEYTGFDFALEYSLKPLRLGVRFIEFPAAYLGRQGGSSSNSPLRTLADLPAALRIRFMNKSRLLKQDSARRR